MKSRVDPNKLPSGTTVYFLVITISSVIVAFWSGQFLPGPEYFTTPFEAQYQPGLYSVVHGFYGLGIVIAISATLFASHPSRKRRAFGPCGPLAEQSAAWGSIISLSKRMGVPIGTVLVDRNINNSEAIAFGVMGSRTILIGQGLALMMEKKRPAAVARLAHEIGHFKNGDVKYAFMARSLLEADTLLMGVVLLWQCIQPARVVVANYVTFMSPLTGLPGNSTALFFKLHALRWTNYWVGQTLGSVMITAPVFAFWTLLLFLEYRSLLRTREVLADADATTWAGSEALLTALKAGRGASKPSFLNRVQELLSPHPLVAERIRVVQEPERVLNPSPLRFLFLGYLWSLVIFLISNINIALSILNGAYGRLQTNPDILTTLVAALSFTNPTASCLWFAVALTFGVTYALILTTLLRSCMSRQLSGQTVSRWLVATLVQIACVAAGAILGSAVHPYGQATQAQLSSDVMLRKPLNGILFEPISFADIANQIGPSCVLFFTAALLWIATRFIVRGRRVRPVRSIEWIALTAFAFLSVFQTYTLIWMKWNYPALQPSIYAFGAAYVAVFLALGTGTVRLIAGSISSKWPPEHFPPCFAATPSPFERLTETGIRPTGTSRI